MTKKIFHFHPPQYKSMTQVNDKNPISQINEFCLTTNSRVFFEFHMQDSDFVAKVIHNGQVIGEGKDKKKQVAKFKAAEIAVSRLKSVKKESKDERMLLMEKEIANLLIRLGRSGKYRLSFKDPIYIYQYYIANELLTEGKCVSEISAKFKCMKKIINKLKPLVFKAKDLESKRSEVEERCEESEKGNRFDYLDCNVRSAADDKGGNRNVAGKEYCGFENDLERVVKGMGFNGVDKKYAAVLEDVVRKIVLMIEIQVVAVGSYSLNCVRREKPVLDFCVVVENLCESSIVTIYQLIEKLYPSSPNPQGSLSASILSELVSDDTKFYSLFPYIRLSYKYLRAQIYFYSSPIHPCLIHYDLMKKQMINSPLIKTMVLLRHWRQTHNITVPIELFDLLLYDLVEPKVSLSSSFRLILEHLSSGLLFPGSPRAPHLPEYTAFLSSCNLQQLYRCAEEALQCLYKISQGGFSGIL